MNLVPVSSAADPRLGPYRLPAIPDPGFVVAEGPRVVERLVAAGYPLASLLVEESRLPLLAPWPLGEAPVYVIAPPVLRDLMGGGYKSGVYARARRPELPGLGTFLAGLPPGAATLVALPRLTTPRNVGAIARVVAGLGADGLLVGESTADPWGRQVARAAMGAVFTLPMAGLHPVVEGLMTLGEAGFQRVALTLAPGAVPLPALRRLGTRAARVVLVLGNEAEGLPPAWESLCDLQVTLPMARGQDSLNVATAAAIFLYEFQQLVVS